MSHAQDAAVLSLGSINADFQLRVEDLASFGTGMRPGHGLLRLSGGKGANVAVLARRLGRDARLLGRVGSDDLAEQALAPLRAEGVDLRAVRRGAGEQTGIAVLGVGPGGSKRSLSAAEANFGFDAGDLDAMTRAVDDAPAGSVLVADYEVTPQAASCAIAAARRRGLRVVVDPSFPHLVQREDLRSVTVLTPNEREARALAGAGEGSDLAEVARALAALGPQAVAIKLDGGGCLLLHEGQLWRQAAAAVRVVDTSGAGDAFTGAMAVALVEGRALRDAVRLAVAVTEIAVTVFGAQPSYPTRRQVDAYVGDAGS